MAIDLKFRGEYYLSHETHSGKDLNRETSGVATKYFVVLQDVYLDDKKISSADGGEIKLEISPRDYETLSRDIDSVNVEMIRLSAKGNLELLLEPQHVCIN